MGSFFGIVAIGTGLYCLYGYIMMVKNRQITKGILLPKDVEPRQCKDVDGYIKMTSIPLLVLGILLLVYGMAEFINQYVVQLGMILWGSLILAVATLAWFAVMTKKANAKYFGI